MNKREQLQGMLTPDNWEHLSFYVTAAAHNECGPDREITDQFWEDAINEIILENRVSQKIMREDHLKIVELKKRCGELQAELDRIYARMGAEEE